MIAILAAVIALLAAVIAFGQFYTARQKLILDLFEHRSEVVTELRAAMAEISKEAVPTVQQIGAFWRAIDRARFLFGPEVIDYLEEMRKQLFRMRALERKIKAGQGHADRDKWIDEESAALEEISLFYRPSHRNTGRFSPAFGPAPG